jgi:transposase InsO family protein
VIDLSAQSRRTDLVLRLPSGHRSVLSAALCVLPHRIAVTQGYPCRRHAIAFRSLGGPTTARSYPYGQAPKYLIRDNDSKFGSCFAHVTTTSGIEILKTPVHAPRANTISERFMRSVRQECLDHLLILHERQIQRVLNAYVSYFNQARPHQGIAQRIPERRRSVPSSQDARGKVIALPVMSGLHHDYCWAA